VGFTNNAKDFHELTPSFPHAFGGNPATLLSHRGAGLDSRQKHAGMTKTDTWRLLGQPLEDVTSLGSITPAALQVAPSRGSRGETSHRATGGLERASNRRSNGCGERPVLLFALQLLGYGHAEGGAGAPGRLQPGAAPVPFGYFLYDGQPQPGSLHAL